MVKNEYKKWHILILVRGRDSYRKGPTNSLRRRSKERTSGSHHLPSFSSQSQWAAKHWRIGRRRSYTLIDNCPSQSRKQFSFSLRGTRVCVITWAPQTTQIFQQLDVSSFGVLKRWVQCKLPFGDDQGTADFMFKVCRTFKQTMIEADIWVAFQAVGFGFDTPAEPPWILFHAEKLRTSPGFREIWSFAFPMEKLSHQNTGAVITITIHDLIYSCSRLSVAARVSHWLWRRMLTSGQLELLPSRSEILVAMQSISFMSSQISTNDG
jgi:hypothetical protein